MLEAVGRRIASRFVIPEGSLIMVLTREEAAAPRVTTRKTSTTWKTKYAF
jgi:hypothetical protein